MSIFDTLLGNSAADTSNAAATDTYAKQQAAIKGLTKYGDTLPALFNNLSQAYTPYASAGSSALKQLMAGLGLGGDPSQFTAAYHNLPGYQAALDTGTRAVTTGANAGNVLQSGATLKALQRFGSDYEDQKSGDYLNRLAGVAGMGEGATNSQVSTQAQGLQDQLATRQSGFQGGMNAAGTIGQGMVAGANAQSTALGNLLGSAAYLGGSALGGGFGTSFGKYLFGK